MTSGGEAVLFWVPGPISVIGVLGPIFAKKAVHADLGTALVMINLGLLYIAQNADFLGSVKIFVYTGAVMMLLLFVVMLVGVDSSNSLVETIKGPDKGLHRWLPAVISVPLAAHLRQASHAPSNGSGNRRGSASSSAVTDSGS